VRRVLIKNKIATGLELENGDKHFVTEWCQVVVSAGAYRIPQVIQLSGIGDPAQLATYGIPSAINLPEVGRNLHDHLLLFRY
jgi:choline dehydrogenase-like flavoprotein